MTDHLGLTDELGLIDELGLTGLRLRPGVGVTRLPGGLHLRGRRSTLTLEGSPALPALWRLLEEALTSGDPATTSSHRAPAGSPLRAALDTLIGHLRAHDLLVAADPQTPGWLSAVADRPEAAAEAIATARTRVLAADPADPLARAATRALTRAGAGPAQVTDAAGPILLTAGPGPAVALAVSADGGFVTPPGSLEQVRADAAALAARLGPHRTDGPAAPASLTALVAGAAVQRLLCAVAGLPDPATEGDDHRLVPDRPSVLVARARPAEATYHPWLTPEPLDPDRLAPLSPPATLAQALQRVAALGDERVGVLAPPLPGALPQLPVALVSCPVAGGTLLAAAARVDLARLDAICRAAELRLGPGTTVGASPDHAWGRALRRAVRVTGGTAAGSVPDRPQARHWWRTLTERLGLAASLTLHQFNGFSHAVVRAPGLPPTSAVEATAGDAAAFAALAAVARTTSAGQAYSHHTRPDGSSAQLAIKGEQSAGWEDEGWTTGWLAELAAREPALRAALHRRTGLRAEPWEPPHAEARAVAAALHGCGFTILRTSGATP